MRKSRKFLSMPIISVTEGQQIGSVKGLVINPISMGIEALLVEQKGFFKEQRVIPYSKITSIGDDAITVSKVANAEKPVNLPEILDLVKDKISPIGTKVITETGKVLGEVEEFYVNPADGNISHLEIASDFLTGLFKGRAHLDRSDLKTMGKDVIVAVSGSEERLTPVETGLSESLKSVKNTSANLWNSTLQQTKELSKNLTRRKNGSQEKPTAVANLQPQETNTAELPQEHEQSPTLPDETSKPPGTFS